MKIEHYPSIEICKLLTEIGFPKTELETHMKYSEDDGCEYREIWFNHEENKSDFIYVCPSVMELLDELPKRIDYQYEGEGKKYRCFIRIDVLDLGYVVYLEDGNRDGNWHKACSESLPNSLADMWIWLVENKYITPKK